MAKRKFDLGDYLQQAGGVQNGHATEQIVRIELDRIDPDPANFYSLEGIEELAANIELVGLLDALRVRPNGERYTIVSGHRRRAALQLIRDGGSEMFADGVPCIVEYGEASEAMRELRLIYANSATRVMSPADLSKQAERVTELLYRLKEQGVEFPGRMRDHVAQACKVSAAKIGRLKAIRTNLRDSYRLLFDAGRLNEGSAYRLSQEEPEVQKKIFEKLGTAVCDLTGEKLDAVIEQVKKPAEDDGPPRASAPTAQVDFERTSAAVDEYLQRRAEEDETFFEALLTAADSFLKCMGGEYTRQEGIERLKKNFRHAGHFSDDVDWQGSGKGLEVNSLDDRPILRTWTETYDMLCSIALNRAWMAITNADEDDEGEMSRSDTGPAWQTGTPPRDGRYLCMVDIGTSSLHEQKCEFQDGAWSCYGRPFDEIGTVEFWWPLPPEKLVTTKMGDWEEETEE